jgi:hypothetical protein
MEDGSVDLLRDTAREFARNTIGPVVMQHDEAQTFHSEIIPQLAELGFMGAMVPEEYGGSGLTPLEFTTLIEEIAAVDPSVGLTLCAHNGLCLGHIARFSSEEQKRRFLPDLCSGRQVGGWGLTEPGSGSDASAMKTTATRDGSSWILNGSKAFITNGSAGSTFVIMAVTGRANGRNRISAFIVDADTPGFTRGKGENKLGMRSSDTAMLTFENVRIPFDRLIGAEGDGFNQTMEVLDGGRIGIAALSVGLARGAFEAAVRYVNERQQFGRPLAAHQAIQWKIADMATGITAARLLTRNAAELRGRGEQVTVAASQAKLFASEIACRTAEEAVQIHGGYGFLKDFPVEKFYRDAKLLTIGEGTSEVQRMIIAKHILR